MHPRFALLPVALTIAAAVTPATAAAQVWREQVARQLDASPMVATLRADGWTVAHGPEFRLVSASARTEVPLQLEGGRAYRFIGKCDDDCSDLDLRVYDPAGERVATDIEADDTPIVSVTPARSGRYVLVVTMAECSTERCGWGVMGLGAAEAGSGWRAQITAQLASSSIVASLKNGGYAESHDVFYDLVERDGSTSVSLPLDAGRSYQLVGKCDDDCSDLDFHLYDAAGALVDSDVEDDDVPLVRVTPRRSGTYRLQVTMAACSATRCGWGVMVLAR